jgi:hypothetical protein
MSNRNVPITVRLHASDRDALADHFINLDGEDRRLRFGSTISNDGLREYVARIDFERDGIFAVHDDEGSRLLAVIHVALSAKSAELGLPEVFVHCLTENGAMMHLARKNRMRIIPAGAETDARLALEPPTAQTVFTEWLHEYHAAAITTVRSNTRFAKTLLGYFAA